MDIYKNKFSIVKDQFNDELTKYNNICKYRSPILHNKIIKAQNLNTNFLKKFAEFETYLENDNIEELTKKANFLKTIGQKNDEYLQSLNIKDLVKQTEWVNKNKSTGEEIEEFGVGDPFTETFNNFEPVFFSVINKIEKLGNLEELESGIEGFGLVDEIKGFFMDFLKIIISVFEFIYKFILFWINFLKELVLFTVWFTKTVIGNFIQVPLITSVLAMLIYILSDLIYRKFTGQLVVFMPPVVITIGLTIYLLIEEFELLKTLQLFFVLVVLHFFESDFVKYILDIDDDTPFILKFKKSRNETDMKKKRKFIAEGIGLLVVFLFKNLLRFLFLLIIVGFILKFCVFDIISSIGKAASLKILGQSV
jgi:hypothetical protein